jgi:hypothetical protein
MTIDKLSTGTQEGLRRWAKATQGDEMMFDANASASEFWAWACFLLRETEDLPLWFPKGKFAVIQIIEQELYREAHDALGNYARSR